MDAYRKILKDIVPSEVLDEVEQVGQQLRKDIDNLLVVGESTPSHIKVELDKNEDITDLIIDLELKEENRLLICGLVGAAHKDAREELKKKISDLRFEADMKINKIAHDFMRDNPEVRKEFIQRVSNALGGSKFGY